MFRTSGSHLVVLNTLLWPEMCYDKAGVKNLRFTAIHPETKQVKIYLITVSLFDNSYLLIQYVVLETVRYLRKNLLMRKNSL